MGRYLVFFGLAGFTAQLWAQPPQVPAANAARALLADADALRMRGSASDLRQAIEKYREASNAFQAAGDRQSEARALFGLGTVFDTLSRKRDAISSYSRALPLFRAERDPAGEADTLIHVGLDYDYLGERKRAAESAAQALDLAARLEPGTVKAGVLTHAGQIYGRAGEREKALDFFRQALPLQQAVQSRRGEATVLSGMGDVYYSMGRSREALENLELALKLYRQARDVRDEAFTLTTMGAVYYSIDDDAQALRYFKQAQAGWEQCGDRSGESANLHNIASTYQRIGELQKAIEYFNRALPIHRAVSYKIGEANTLTNLGRLYAGLGDYSSALAFYAEALPIHRATANREGEGRTLQSMGDVYASLGDWQKAIQRGLEALPLRRAISDRAGEADTLNHLAVAYARSGDQSNARTFAGKALELFRAVGSPRGEAMCLSALALSNSRDGLSAEAIDAYRQAAALFQSVGDQRGEAFARYGLAREERAAGRLAEARRDAENALETVESLRASVLSPELRSYFFASMRDYFELEIDVLMRLHGQDPTAGFAAAALEMSERSHARGLIDLLAETHIDIREGVDPALLDRERSLGRRLDAVAARHLSELLARPAEARKTSAGLARLTTDYRAVEAEIRAASPRYAALMEPQPLSAREIQRELLDRDTVLIEYSLGSEHSYAWVVSRDSLDAYALPAQAEIEAAAARFHRLLSAGDPAANEAGRRLSDLIVAPLKRWPDGKRLVIVADGALQYVPFAALPQPAVSRYQPLLARYEIVSLPSASVLQSLRGGAAARRAPSKTIAVLADPVFRRDDPRVGGHSPSAVASAARGTPSNLARLAGSRREAEAILSFAPASGRKAALDFDASLAAATDLALADYRIVHFATHAFVDPEQPELSSIVLSLVDREGRPQEGVLRLRDIYNLRWRSELVVLSACQTALGQEIRGEGFVGLTRGFLYAGAPRVMASLWKIDDRQTTALMRDFYRGLLGPRRLSAAAALRAAQLKMAQADGQPLSAWAAFVLTGDWR